MKWFPFILLLSPLICFSQITEDEGVRRVKSHLLIDDPSSALEEAVGLVERFPDSTEVRSALIEALAAGGFEEKALEAWGHLSAKVPDLGADRHLLEELSWGILRKGLESTQYGIRLASLIGAYLTHDVRAMSILLKMMRDSNAVIRSVAVQMAASFRDAPLKDEIARMMNEEKLWIVRLEVIKAAGQLRMKSLAPKLKALVQSEKTTYEERTFAIEALLSIYDDITFDEWKALAHSNRAGLRHLACSVAAHFHLDEAREGVLNLIHDSHPDVRIAALNAFGLHYRKNTSLEETKERLSPVLADPTPEVAITAAWAALIADAGGGENLARWVGDSLPENRRLAAAALSASGRQGVKLSTAALKESTDPYVKANLAMGLLGQRQEVGTCCDILYEFLQGEKRLWMWDTRPNPLFQVLAPSQVRHVDHIPNYPEAIDQMTRLNLVSLLALVEDPRALGALKNFLQKRTWGITGVAAATLLQEGDESSLEVVRQLLTDPEPNVRLQACLVLAMLGRDETVLQDLQNAYVGADHERKLHILEAMGRVGSIETFHFLISVFKEPFPILRIAAAAALIQSLNR
jgi:HEAT repeat protein